MFFWEQRCDKGLDGLLREYLVLYILNILRCIFDGEYFFCIQQFGFYNLGVLLQFYISCVQVKVMNGGSMNLSFMVLILGVFKSIDLGYNVNVSFYC